VILAIRFHSKQVTENIFFCLPCLHLSNALV
jgi:hypothetical protein